MIKDLLPIGSVVLLNNGRKKVMIFGIKQTHENDEKVTIEYDYIGVLYPEGNIGAKYQFLFNQQDISEVFFRGYEDEERESFINKLSEVYKENEN